MAGLAVDLAHRREARRGVAGTGRTGLGAEEQQLGQPVRDASVAGLEQPELRQQARRNPLREDVGVEQALRLASNIAAASFHSVAACGSPAPAPRPAQS